MTEYLNGNEIQSKYAPTTQVYKATHDGVGKRLPYMYRSFISFSYGGKIIEDFNLIAVTDGDRINRNAYANFEDNVETYDVIDGQFYWGSHYTNNQLELLLSTDGITQTQLDDFKAWFVPGKARELILAEHPNRAIMARVSTQPQISLLPFEYTTSTFILGKKYETSITQYKGDIRLSFTMDEPYWYAKYSLIGPYLEDAGANSIVNIAQDPERIRDLIAGEIITEDDWREKKPIVLDYKDRNNEIKQIIFHIKSFASFADEDWFEDEQRIAQQYWKITGVRDQDKSKMSSKDDTTYDITFYYPDEILNVQIPISPLGDQDFTKILVEDNIPFFSMIEDDVIVGEGLGVDLNSSAESRIYDPESGRGAHINYYGYIDRNSDSGGIGDSISKNSKLYLYYSGTAPSKPILNFTFTPTFNSENYINEPRNSYSNKNIIATNDYNYIAIGNNKFKITTPSLLTGYNQAISIVKNYESTSAIEVKTLLRENINEYYARAWAMYCIESIIADGIVVNNDGAITNLSTFKNNFVNKMKQFICLENGPKGNAVICSFNSKTGEATGIFNVNTYNGQETSWKEVEENIGDMVRSDYLIIEGRNYPNTLGYITKRECKTITTDFIEPLTGVSVIFQNMYL